NHAVLTLAVAPHQAVVPDRAGCADGTTTIDVGLGSVLDCVGAGHRGANTRSTDPAHAVGTHDAVLSHRARGTNSTAVDVGLAAIFDGVVARRCHTETTHADVA